MDGWMDGWVGGRWMDSDLIFGRFVELIPVPPVKILCPAAGLSPRRADSCTSRDISVPSRRPLSPPMGRFPYLLPPSDAIKPKIFIRQHWVASQKVITYDFFFVKTQIKLMEVLILTCV